jgi:hypothetical protein
VGCPRYSCHLRTLHMAMKINVACANDTVATHIAWDRMDIHIKTCIYIYIHIKLTHENLEVLRLVHSRASRNLLRLG